MLKEQIKKAIPKSVKKFMLATHAQLRSTAQAHKPIFRAFKRTKPISPIFGLDRGQPIDRYYIEKFLEQNKSCIHGRTLEIENAIYTKKFGGTQVTKSDILHATTDNPKATIIADLTNAPHIPSNQFDCIIFTQTLQFIYEKQAAIKTLHRILKPGGTLLVTVPGICQISRYDMDRWGDYWRFTSLSAKMLFKETFSAQNVFMQTYGNVLSSVSFLHGLAAEEIKKKKLDHHDPDYQLVISIKAIK